MIRNLLPRMQPDANLAPLPVGRWSVLQAPGELARIEFAQENEGELRTRIQSIPSPWARLFLFRHALQDPQHPARRLVENDFLDALEFAWSLGMRPGVNAEIRRVRLDELRARADDTGSPRVGDFAAALLELAPRRRDGGAQAGSALPAVTLLLVDGQPAVASSPYTLLFTAEDAGRAVGGEFFGYARGAEARPLAQRPTAFQRYVAQVVYPQVSGAAPAGGESAEWTTVQQCVTQWLVDELARCRAAAPERVRPQLNPAGVGDWRAAAAAQQLEALGDFGGLVLFRRGSEELPSRWRLRAPNARRQLPLVIDPESFDGRYHEGAQAVQLPPDLRRLPRDVLPGSGQHEPWVAPALDWLTDRLFVLSDPLDAANVKGLAGYRVQGDPGDPRFAPGQARLALPLRGDFFTFFTPDEVDRVLAVDVLAGGAVRVTLRLRVGTEDDERELAITRVYPREAIRVDVGPQLVLWPSFRDPAWREYALFRIDRVANNVEIAAWSGQEALAQTGAERRSASVGVQTFGAAPEVLELRDTAPGKGARAEPLGVVLPRYRDRTAGNAAWKVGIDFGTSNTLVAIRESDRDGTGVFEADEVLLPLTRPGADTERFLESYFFPGQIAPEAFGTAIYHLVNLPTLELHAEPVALRTTVPFDGRVENDATNRIVGNLKWANDRENNFLTAAFLRHLTATVLTAAVRRGVQPGNVEFAYSYPRAFEPAQLENLEDLWHQVKTGYAARGVELKVQRGADESRCVLEHFRHAGLVGRAGDADIVVDVGGGTTDIAAYGAGRTLVLDSIHLGGRDLTGRREQAETRGGLRNPFVEAFVRWAMDNGFPEPQRPVLQKYLGDGQVHLAFTYLMRSEWHRGGSSSLFRATPAGEGFQLLVFYFFAALFHHLGLSFRALRQAGGPATPFSVTFAGNGSQYLKWVGGPRSESLPPHLRTALVQVFGAASGADASRLELRISARPKEEVASGLVVPLARAGAGDDPPLIAHSVVGEAVTAPLAQGAAPRTLGPTDHLEPGEQFAKEDVARVAWADGEMEIERFHRSVVQAARQFAAHGGHWTQAPARFERFFASMDGPALRQATRRRLEYLAELNDGFSGSLFILAAAGVLERMMDEFVGEP
jgi:hypothetical protein